MLLRSAVSISSLFSLFSLLMAPLLSVATVSPLETSPSKPEPRVILFIGDSITEGYGITKEESYPEKVGKILNAKSQRVRVINGGISGSVTAEADRRLRWFLKAKPEILVLALGANDGLKGTPVKVIKSNLAQVIDLAKQNNVKVLLTGMRVFENLGADYTRAFAQMYGDLAREKKVTLLPFLLEGVALDQSLNQADGKHPNARGSEVIAKNVARELERLL